MLIGSLEEAEIAIRRRLSREGHEPPTGYDRAKAIENERWFYIPCRSLGSVGCIVNKADGYVNWLGSALTLDDCVWGHDHGIFCDLVDFSFDPSTSLTLVANLLEKFQHMQPNASGVLPTSPIWYRQSEIKDAIARYFPAFKRHFVWFAIPEIRAASENNGLLFTSKLTSPEDSFR